MLSIGNAASLLPPLRVAAACSQLRGEGVHGYQGFVGLLCNRHAPVHTHVPFPAVAPAGVGVWFSSGRSFTTVTHLRANTHRAAARASFAHAFHCGRRSFSSFTAQSLSCLAPPRRLCRYNAAAALRHTVGLNGSEASAPTDVPPCGPGLSGVIARCRPGAYGK